MIISIDRGTIKVSLDGKIISVPGEMFFPPNEKIGFSIYLEGLKHWDYPHHEIAFSGDDIARIIDDIRQDFEKGGHTLEFE